ncbi:MAG: hypothetical protein HY924_10545 [Elusimicrobia bacterium]|nr:hypothetical protein [Elusimicrobiota bacterium]
MRSGLLAVVILSCCAAARAAEFRTVLPGVQVNDLAFINGSYAVATSSGLFRLDRKLQVLRRRADTGSVSALAADGDALYVGSECGVFREEGGRWTVLSIPDGAPAECDGSRNVRAMCLNTAKAGKGRGRKTLFVSLEDTTTENVESLGLFSWDVSRDKAERVAALRDAPSVTAMLCGGDLVFLGTDGEAGARDAGQVFAYDPRSGTASPASAGLPRSGEEDSAEITALARRGDLLLVGRYAGHGTGQCVLAAGRGAFGRDPRWSCLLSSEADLLEGVSSVQTAGKGHLAASGLMANVDSARVFRVGPDLEVSEVSNLMVPGQLVGLKARDGKVFLLTTEGLVVAAEKDLSARPPRP